MSDHSVTIKDIARILGISKSTVSRALAEHVDVNPSTRKKILELADKLQYEPNTIALHLKQKRTYTLGLIVPETPNTFLSETIAGIQQTATLQNYHVIVCQSMECYDTERNAVKSLIASQVDGLLISVSRETKNADHFQSAVDKKIPIVFFDRIVEHVDTSHVLIDHYQISRQATQHLIDEGCRRIACISGPSSLLTSRKRVEGYQDALSKNNLSFNTDYLMYSPFREETAQRFTHQLIHLRERPDAILATDDSTAIEMMHIIKKHGLRIPHDIALVGLENEHASQFVEPSLTTIGIPANEMGRIAAEVLLLQIKNRDYPPEKRIINGTLIMRDSSRRRSKALCSSGVAI
jgi:DNA-binding LacI/PurR family transcriptional regulator